MKAVKKIVLAIGLLGALFGAYLFIVGLMPGFPEPKRRLRRTKGRSEGDESEALAFRQEVSFPADGTSISAWFYAPETTPGAAPCIVMANGLGGTKDMGLEPYAIRFREAGFAVLLFDYRYFGASGGRPRQLIWMPAQLEDYAAAVEFARVLDEVDPERIALWGTSLSSGHVLVRAAEDRRISCIVAQCPGLDGRAGAEMAFEKLGLAHGLKLIVHGQRDLVRSWLGLPAHKIPIVGQTGAVALMSGDEFYEAFAEMAPADFVNEACARITIRGDKYRPVTRASEVHCPALFQICDYDELTPVGAIEKTAGELGELAQVIRYSIGHFDIYSGDGFEQSVSDQVAFLQLHLGQSEG